MSELLIKRTKDCDCTDDDECNDIHGWDTRICCGQMSEHMAEAGGGGLFFIASEGRLATGLQIDPTLDGELLPAVACPFCGASVRVVDELPPDDRRKS